MYTNPGPPEQPLEKTFNLKNPCKEHFSRCPTDKSLKVEDLWACGGKWKNSKQELNPKPP